MALRDAAPISLMAGGTALAPIPPRSDLHPYGQLFAISARSLKQDRGYKARFIYNFFHGSGGSGPLRLGIREERVALTAEPEICRDCRRSSVRAASSRAASRLSSSRGWTVCSTSAFTSC